MNLSRLISLSQTAYTDVALRCGGSKGPSSSELVAQENAAKARAQAEADKIRAQRDLEKQNENARITADQAATANADASRRARNRTLLAGLQEEEPSSLLAGETETKTTAAEKKAKRATLIGSVGGGI